MPTSMRADTATSWAERQLAIRPDVTPGAVRALRQICESLDAAAAESDRAMFAPGVLTWAMVGFHPRVLHQQLDVPVAACQFYCAELHLAGLLQRDPRGQDLSTFAVPTDAWMAATSPY